MADGNDEDMLKFTLVHGKKSLLLMGDPWDDFSVR